MRGNGHDRRWIWAAVGAIVGSALLATYGQRAVINPDGWPQMWKFLRASLHPDGAMVPVAAKAAVTTLAYAVCGTSITVVLGLIGGLLCSEVWWTTLFPRTDLWKPVWLAVRLLLAIPRAIHELIWGLLFINLWGLDPLTGIVAIALPFGAITAKVFSELLDETPRQPMQALVTSGVPPAIALLYGLIPLVWLDWVSYMFYRFECSLRSAAVLGMIGAGGLGYEMMLSLQSLKYAQLWTFFYAMIGLNGAVDFSSAWVRHRLGCTSRLDLNAQNRRQSARPTPRFWGLFWAIVLPLIGLCFWTVQANISKLWAVRTWRNLGTIAQQAWPPDWSSLSSVVTLSIPTIALSILAIALASLGGTGLSFPAARPILLGDRTRMTWIQYSVTRLVLLICRAIPAPIWALVILYGVFPGIWPGAIALGIHNLGILGRLQAEVIENLDRRPLWALQTQGASKFGVFCYGILPLTVPRFLAYGLYRWEVCMRETVIVGLVGAGGLGRVLTEQLSSFDYRGLVVTLLGFLGLTFGVDWVSAQVRRSLR